MTMTQGRVLITRDQIARRVRELGEKLAEDLRADLRAEGADLNTPGRVVLIPVLTGAIVFVADLIRQMPMNMSMGVVSVSSYPGATTESIGVTLRGELPRNLRGRHVVIVDDILDTGRTLSLLQQLISDQEPASLRTCVMLRKDAPRIEPAEAEYVGFDIPGVFVVGYGLDYDGQHRNLPDICELDSGT